MRVYIDEKFHCHTTNPDNAYREFEVPFFDGKCKTFIEGFMYIPTDEIWTRSDGMIFVGKIITNWKDYDELDSAQREYERQQIAEYESALSEIETALGVTE